MNSDDQQILSILHSCDDEQLKKYMNDENECEVLVRTLDSYQALASERQLLESTNRSLADTNMAMEAKLDAAKARLRAELDEYERAKRDYLSLKETYDANAKCGDDMSLQALLSALQTRAQRAEEDSDRQADEYFVSSGGVVHTDDELNAFQKQFLEERTQAHMIKINADKLKELKDTNLTL